MTTAVASAGVQESILLREDEAGITTLTLNRPKQYNSLSEAMLTALESALNGISGDKSVRVVVIAGSGRAFCAGHDLKEMRSTTVRTFHRGLFERCSRVMLAINHLPQPVIARVHGIATAAGCQLVAACDLAVAAENARFAVSGINVGLFCATPAVALSRNLGRKKAMELLLTGDFIDARTALAYGLLNRVVGPEALEATTRALAESILAKSPLAVTTGKQMFYRQLEMDMEEAYRYAGETMVCNLDSEDAREGIDAFVAKRQPHWRGR